MCYFIISGVFVSIVFLYNTLELHYFLRTTLTVLVARFFKKQAFILEETTVKGICLTTDIDTFLYHMNNARFLRELDFARLDFYERTGLYNCIRKKGGTIAMGASTIRYRRFIRLFNAYLIKSKIIFWDDQGIFMEHRFVTPSDKFINAIAISKMRLINCSTDEILSELFHINDKENVENGMKLIKPELTLELAKWIESNEISSKFLRSAS